MSLSHRQLQLLARISSAVAAQAALTRQLVPVESFLAVIDRRTDVSWASFALPDPARWTAGPLDLLAALPGLEEVFSHSGRKLRFEFFEDLWPGLAPELERAGFTGCSTSPSSPAIRTGSWPGPARASRSGTLPQRIRTSSCASSSAPRPWRSARIRARPSPGPADLGRKREDLLAGAQRCCLGFVGGEAAGAGSSLVAGDTCEIAGIGTLPRWRGRGVASAIVGALVREHFQKGGSLAWLSAADERAGSVYRGIGFRPTGALQATCDRPAS